jgi:Transposase DDE domain
MRHCHCTITPDFVRSTARGALEQALDWRPHGRTVSVAKLLDLLLLAAALGSSLYAVVTRFLFGFSHETARQAVRANLPDQGRLTDGLLDALHGFGGRLLRRRRWVAALDVHLDPFYGDPGTPGAVGGKKKQGTKYFFGYATAVLVHHRHRYTVGLLALRGGEKPHEVVAALLGQLEARGLKPRGVVLDAGFDSGDVLRLLQEEGLSYAVPLQRKGRGSNRRNACWELEAGSVCTAQWRTERGRLPVSTEAVVLAGPRPGHKRVFAFGGWQAGAVESVLRRARLAKRWYRKRFGIETSYRQLRQGKAKTTAKDVAYRLLLVGIGLLLRQAWVWLTWQLARDGGLRPTAWVEALPLERLCEWLSDLLKGQYQEEKVIRLNNPLLPLDFARV